MFLHTRTSRSATLHLLFLESLFKISSSCRLPNLHGNAGCSFANACLPLHVSQMMTRLCGLLIPWAPFHTARAAHAGGRCTCTLRWRDVQWLCGQWKPPPGPPPPSHSHPTRFHTSMSALYHLILCLWLHRPLTGGVDYVLRKDVEKKSSPNPVVCFPV